MGGLLRGLLVLGYLLVACLPLVWMGLTAIKPKHFTTAAHPNILPAIGMSETGDVDLRPPAAVRSNAVAALEAYAADAFPMWGEGDQHLARRLAEGAMLELTELRRLQAWFSGHATWPQRPDYASRELSFQEWNGRGGAEAVVWLGELMTRLDERQAFWRESLFFPPVGDGFAGLARPRTVGSERTFVDHLLASVIIGLASTLAAVVLGTSTAYGFSRFRIPGSRDWLFFILSTRFLPPLAVVVPILMMWRRLGLENSHLGLIILYTAFNLSLAVWLMKGFIDEIPRAYEEAALVDGYSRWQAFLRIILPQAGTGMAVTAVFCLIAAWNEYGFAVTLNQHGATTVPVFFAGQKGGTEGIDWPQLAAGSLLFVVPIIVFVVLVRKHLLRGVTFGTVKG